MIFFHQWLNKYTIHWQFMTSNELWTSIFFVSFKTPLVIAPPPTPIVIMTHCIRKSICDSPLTKDRLLGWALISKISFDFKMKFRFQNWSTVSKLRFDFKKKLRSSNWPSIWKWSFNFKVELIFQTKNLISKSSLVSKSRLDFEMQLRFQNWT